MSPATKVIRRILDEEIERLGVWWDVENTWAVYQGTDAETRQPVDLISEAFESVAARTGIAVETIRDRFRPLRALDMSGCTLTSSVAHRKRRLSDGTLRKVPRTPGDGSNPFIVYEPVS